MRRTRVSRTLALGALVAPLLLAQPGAAQVQGNTYYAAPGGVKPPTNECWVGGGETDPWGSIEFAMRCLHPGDTLIVRGGEYVETVLPVTRNGAADARITVRNAPGERPLVRGVLWLQTTPAAQGGSGFDYWTIDGINVTRDPATSDALIWLVKFRGSTNWVFANSEVWGARSFGAVRVEGNPSDPSFRGPSHWRIVGNCIHTTVATNPPYQDHNLYVGDTGTTTGPGVVERNVLFGAPNGNNIKVGPNAGNVSIRYNTLVNGTMNILAEQDSRNVLAERNLMVRGPVPPHQSWYPNIRGFRLVDHNNIARANAGFGADTMIRNHSDGPEPPGWRNGGANFVDVDPRFDGMSSCDQFRPRNGVAMAFGRYSRVDRTFGDGRVQTSVALSRATFAPAATNAVVIARADAFPDALAGAPLAAKVGGPILLTTSHGLHPDTRTEVQRLRVTTAYLLGGQAALSEQVRADLQAAGVGNVVRLGGTDRFDTARLVAVEVGGTEVFVVEGAHADPRRGWPDAVSVAPVAAQVGHPILLVTRDRLPSATRTALEELGATAVTIVGGEAAVSRSVADQIANYDADGATVTRIAGANRYDTSVRVASLSVQLGADGNRTWLATGLNWPDALAAGPAVVATGGALVLVHGFDLDESPPTRTWLADRAATMQVVDLVGGTAAISGFVEGSVAATLGNP